MNELNPSGKAKRTRGGFKKFMTAKKSQIAITLIVVLIIFCSIWAVKGIYVGPVKWSSWVSHISYGLDLRGGVYATYQIENAKENQKKVQELNNVILQRLYAKGYNEATVVLQGTDRIRVEIPDVQDPEQVMNLIGKPGKLEFYGKSSDGKHDLIMTGDDMDFAVAGYDSASSPVVSFKLKSSGATKFAQGTQKYLGDRIYIALDGTEFSAPIVKGVISGGSGEITDIQSIEEAKSIATYIMSGSLPLKIHELEIRTISATLGAEALKLAMIALIVSFAAILIFMVAFYKMLGLIADISMLVYALILVFVEAFFPWGMQLTLPSIAGLILSVGMAVDTNIIVYERIKEEYKAGKSLTTAVSQGFHKAFITVFDSNITTILTAIILYVFGTTQLKGFAISLTVGILASFFTAITVTRYLLNHIVLIRKNIPFMYNTKKLTQKEVAK